MLATHDDVPLGEPARPRRLGHYPRCYGCGSANPRGLGLDVRWDESSAHVRYTPPPDSEGAPGIVHGGYISAIVDEVMALVASAGQIPAMTRRIEVDYRSPALTGQPLDIRAQVDSTSRRTVMTSLAARPHGQDHVCFEAKGVYVKLPTEVWLKQMAPRDPATGELDLSNTTASTFFRYHLHALTQLYNGESLARPLRVHLHLNDVEPPAWCLHAGADGLEVEERDCGGDEDVWLRGDFQSWEALLHDPSRLDGLIVDGSVEVEGEVLLFVGLLDCLPVLV